MSKIKNGGLDQNGKDIGGESVNPIGRSDTSGVNALCAGVSLHR